MGSLGRSLVWIIHIFEADSVPVALHRLVVEVDLAWVQLSSYRPAWPLGAPMSIHWLLLLISTTAVFGFGIGLVDAEGVWMSLSNVRTSHGNWHHMRRRAVIGIRYLIWVHIGSISVVLIWIFGVVRPGHAPMVFRPSTHAWVVITGRWRVVGSHVVSVACWSRIRGWVVIDRGIDRSATVWAHHVLWHRGRVSTWSILVGAVAHWGTLWAIVIRTRWVGWVCVRHSVLMLLIVAIGGGRIWLLRWVLIVRRLHSFSCFEFTGWRIVHPVTRGTHSCASLLVRLTVVVAFFVYWRLLCWLVSCVIVRLFWLVTFLMMIVRDR